MCFVWFVFLDDLKFGSVEGLGGFCQVFYFDQVVVWKEESVL